MKKIVVLDGYTLNPGDLSWKDLEALGRCTVYDRTAPEDTVARAEDAEIVITNKTELSSDVIEKLANLKYIGVLATGYNVVDIEAARSRGIFGLQHHVGCPDGLRSLAEPRSARRPARTNGERRKVVFLPGLLLLGYAPDRIGGAYYGDSRFRKDRQSHGWGGAGFGNERDRLRCRIAGGRAGRMQARRTRRCFSRERRSQFALSAYLREHGYCQ